jgi:NADH-quinone oxidoreductase subunit K
MLAAGLFCVGLYGLLSRRQAVAVLLSVELMANAANVAFVAFSRFRGGATGQVFAVFALALTVAEVAIGLAIVMLLHRTRVEARVDAVQEMKG